MTRKPPYQITRAKVILRTLGPRVAARYLCLRGWSIESALWIVCKSTIAQSISTKGTA